MLKPNTVGAKIDPRFTVLTGRARQKDSEMVNITSEDNKEVQGKEKMNVFRERKSICILKG